VKAHKPLFVTVATHYRV